MPLSIVSAAAALTILTVVDQAPLDCRLEITGRREGGCQFGGVCLEWRLAQIFGRA